MSKQKKKNSTLYAARVDLHITISVHEHEHEFQAERPSTMKHNIRERKRGSARSLAFIIAETSGDDEESQHRWPGMISLIISIKRYPIGNEKRSVIVYMASCAKC